jgi:hypothetical protein
MNPAAAQFPAQRLRCRTQPSLGRRIRRHSRDGLFGDHSGDIDHEPTVEVAQRSTDDP